MFFFIFFHCKLLWTRNSCKSKYYSTCQIIKMLFIALLLWFVLHILKDYIFDFSTNININEIIFFAVLAAWRDYGADFVHFSQENSLTDFEETFFLVKKQCLIATTICHSLTYDKMADVIRTCFFLPSLFRIERSHGFEK